MKARAIGPGFLLPGTLIPAAWLRLFTLAIEGCAALPKRGVAPSFPPIRAPLLKVSRRKQL
jgi:hypothetical protein